MELVLSSDSREQPELRTPACTVLHVAIAGLALGGAERIVLDWAARISRRWEVHIIVLRDHEQEWSVPDFIKTTRLHGADIDKKLTVLGQRIAESGNPVCLCHLLTARERRSLADRGACAVPVLHNASQGWLEDVSALRNNPCVIAVSSACAQELHDGGRRCSTSVIHHFPRQRRLAPDARRHFRKAWNIPENAAVIGMIGAVKPQKNYRFALAVLKALHEKKDAFLVIVGGPIGRHGRSEWRGVVEVIGSMKLRPRVAMPGFIPDAASCLAAFDVLLNTSRYEGLSMATLEALASGMPVVAANVGGQGEIAHEGLKLLSVHDAPEKWAQALEAVMLQKFLPPAWSRFPAYRLWTLAHLAGPMEKTNRVLFVTANLNSGGAQRSLVNLAEALNGKLQFEVAVTGNSTSDYFFLRLQEAGIRVFRSAETNDAFDHAEMLVSHIGSNKIGTVCFWNLDSKIKLLLVKTLHAAALRFIDVSPGSSSFREMADTADFQQLICFSQTGYYQRLDSLVLKYRGAYPCEYAGRIRIIPNGVPAPSTVKTDYAPGRPRRIIVQGRIAPGKFILEIMQAVQIVWQTMPDVELHIAGAAEPRCAEYARLVVQAAGAEIGRRIFLHGQNFKMAESLPGYDICVVLGTDQGCPNTILEALSVGLPVVANDSGGTREQILDGRTGLLVAGCSSEEVAQALLRILNDSSLAERLGRAGRKHALKFFSLDTMARRYMMLFNVTGRHGFFYRLWLAMLLRVF